MFVAGQGNRADWRELVAIAGCGIGVLVPEVSTQLMVPANPNFYEPTLLVSFSAAFFLEFKSESVHAKWNTSPQDE